MSIPLALPRVKKAPRLHPAPGCVFRLMTRLGDPANISGYGPILVSVGVRVGVFEGLRVGNLLLVADGTGVSVGAVAVGVLVGWSVPVAVGVKVGVWVS